MGSWGEGIFENDEAQDFLGDLMEGLSSHVAEHVDGEGFYLGSVAPAVEVMLMLAKQWQTIPPKPVDIEQWRRNFSRALKQQGGESENSESTYYGNVMAAFDALKEVSEGFEHEEYELDDLLSFPVHEFREGMEVIHPKFGEGKILLIEGEGATVRGNVAFEAYGEKWLVLALAGLVRK
jgi:hypothetical protein